MSAMARPGSVAGSANEAYPVMVGHDEAQRVTPHDAPINTPKEAYLAFPPIGDAESPKGATAPLLGRRSSCAARIKWKRHSSVLEVAHLGPLVFDVRDDDGAALGTVAFPDFAVHRGRNELRGATARFEKGRGADGAVQAFFTRFAAGEQQPQATIAGYGRKGGNPRLKSSTPDSVESTGTTTFFSDAPAPVHVGDAVMAIHAPSGARLGTVAMADLTVDAALNAYLLGQEQTLEIRGPVGGSHMSRFIAGTIALNATFAGSANPRSVVAAYYSHDSLSGYT
eukprot:gene25119-14313_t